MSFDQFVAVIRAFERERVEYVLVGGVAVNVYGIVRTTEAVDFFVRPTPENVARIRAALRSLWADPQIEEITAADLAGAYPTVRYGPPDGDILIDVLAGLGTAFRFEDLESERRSIGDVVVNVGYSGHAVQDEARHTAARDQADAVLLRERFGLSLDED